MSNLTVSQAAKYIQKAKKWDMRKLLREYAQVSKQNEYGSHVDQLQILSDEIISRTEPTPKPLSLVDKAAELGYILNLSESGEVEYLYPISRKGFTPEITRQGMWPDDPWNIQTYGYGAKDPATIQKIIEGQQRAIKMVELLAK